jgi:hypothetical protein
MLCHIAFLDPLGHFNATFSATRRANFTSTDRLIQTRMISVVLAGGLRRSLPIGHGEVPPSPRVNAGEVYIQETVLLRYRGNQSPKSKRREML